MGVHRMTRLQVFSWVTVIATLSLIALGSVVRTTGSGLGCPDWPLCHGGAVPPLERTAMIEWSHRTLAAVTGLLIVAQAVWVMLTCRRDHALLLASSLTVPLLVVQAILGREAVVRELPPSVVAAHMVSALALVALLTVVASIVWLGPARRRDQRPEGASFRAATRLTVVVIGAVMVLGTYNLATGAGAACLNWPGCPDAPIPFLTGERLHHIHWLHRLSVLAGLGSVVLLAALGRQSPAISPRLERGAIGTLALYVAQAALGAAIIWSDFAAVARSAHVLASASSWALLIALFVMAHRVPSTVHPPVARGAVVTL